MRELGGVVQERMRVYKEGKGFTFLDPSVLKLPWKLGELSLHKEASHKSAHKNQLVLGFSGINMRVFPSH